jgi:hypothetical protein
VTPAQRDDEMSVMFDSKVFGDNFGTGVLAITLLGYRNGNFEETDTVFNSAISWDSYRGNLTPRFMIFTALRSTNLVTLLGSITPIRRSRSSLSSLL